jgi:CheY-like chemotaxis protein
MGEKTVVGKRILLAEDQPGVRQAIRYLLHMDDHDVTEAANGREALELFTQNNYDLVITDYAMPEMAGDELAIRIKHQIPSQPIIMITAYAEEFTKCGRNADALLSKPFSFIDLRQAIARLLRA